MFKQPGPPLFKIGKLEGANATKFVEISERLWTALNHKPAEESLPKWHTSFLITVETDAIKKREVLANKKKQIEASLKQADDELNSLHELKYAFTAKGDKLVEVVKRLLEILGFLVSDGPEGRDDLIASKGDLVAVLEVKGRDENGAAEKDAAQLEKWVSRYYEEHEKEPKGILVVNGYRTLSLDKRVRPIFPEQMLPYVKRKQLCLISGLQLLCLALSARTVEQKEAAVLKLINTIGIFEDYLETKWMDVISQEYGNGNLEGAVEQKILTP